MSEFVKLFAANLTNWVEAQKAFLDTVEAVEKNLENADRLELILTTRAAFSHMVKTIEAFDKWLQDPFIVGHMPREMLLDVQRSVWEILKKLLELDIRHTTAFRDMLLKLSEDGKLNPVFFMPRGEQKPEERFRVSY
ncbi:DUF2153 domain-containing protein [Thermofilum pendens]|uniref:DUF2153 domain-containing protein n=1 Tax=Thermofilum pendens (strain DSM 2475 / Hrk 5) TaxID=368408 RepID=A1RWC2_THEPD|nr:DUF2153 domain-containing protein [Thermofilum pendens]ABL77502.1 conserved hypothetical protein [Thermofilum pendens Hrk 5]